jgi:hypothetical protein
LNPGINSKGNERKNMADFTVKINNEPFPCTPHPDKIPVNGKIVQGTTVAFENQVGRAVKLNFATPPGSPFGINPVPVPIEGTPPLPITADPGQKTSYSYQVDCSGTSAVSAADGGGDGIIIVDGGGLPRPKGKSTGKKSGAAKKGTATKSGAKSAGKSKSKAKPKGKSKAKGGKKAAPKRKASKVGSKKK